jgi:hypothetical protein
MRMFARPDYWAVCYLGLARADLRRKNAAWPINPLPKSVNVPGSGVVAGMGVVGIKVLEDAVQTVQKDYRTISISLSPGL